jgi:putative MATE family efflux protein
MRQAQQTKRMQRMILKGPIVKTMLILGWPLMLTQAFQMCYSLADTYWLGQYVGDVGVAATTLAWPIVFFLVSFAGGMSVAGTSLVAQYTGMKNKAEAKRSAGQVFALLTLFAVLLSMLGILITDPLLSFMGAEPEVVQRSSSYIKIIFTSMPFMFIIMTFTSILRGWGDTRTPMYISAASVTLNMFLDPILITGVGSVPALGVSGAAYATLISRSLGALACVYFLFRGRDFRITLADMRLKAERVKQIFRIGLPASLGQSLVALGFIVLMSFVASFGTDILAVHGIGTRIINMVFIVTGGLVMAAVTMIGQNLGADKVRRAERVLNRTILVAAVFLVACSTFFFIFSEQLFSVFINDRDVVSHGRTFMMTFGTTIIGFGIFQAVQAAYQASGRTVPSMIMGMLRLWALRIPLTFVLGFTLSYGAFGVWLGMGISNFLGAVLALAWAATGSWKLTVVEKKVPVIREPLA